MPTPRWLKNLLDLVPPVRESRRFRYFDFWRHHPFQPDDTHFRLTNAGWLAEAAMLAYSPPEEALEIFERFGPGRTAIEFVRNAERDTSCYLLINDAFVTGVFRGSEILRPDRWRSLDDARANLRSVVLDWWGNAETPLLPVRRRSPRRAHAGFLHDLDSIWPAIGLATRATATKAARAAGMVRGAQPWRRAGDPRGRTLPAHDRHLHLRCAAGGQRILRQGVSRARVPDREQQ